MAALDAHHIMAEHRERLFGTHAHKRRRKRAGTGSRRHVVRKGHTYHARQPHLLQLARNLLEGNLALGREERLVVRGRHRWWPPGSQRARAGANPSDKSEPVDGLRAIVRAKRIEVAVNEWKVASPEAPLTRGALDGR